MCKGGQARLLDRPLRVVKKMRGFLFRAQTIAHSAASVRNVHHSCVERIGADRIISFAKGVLDGVSAFDYWA